MFRCTAERYIRALQAILQVSVPAVEMRIPLVSLLIRAIVFCLFPFVLISSHQPFVVAYVQTKSQDSRRLLLFVGHSIPTDLLACCGLSPTSLLMTLLLQLLARIPVGAGTR